MTTPAPQISVVVASQNARGTIVECLSALLSQARTFSVELIIVDSSSDETTVLIREQFPHVVLLALPPGALIPELWKVGIEHSTATIVAITTAHFIPAPDWLQQILKAHEAAAPAIGGAIENDEAGRVVDWAVYFCRYSPYMLPFSEGAASEIAGDNASYKRESLDRCRQAWRTGFWEPEVHAEMKKAGERLLLAPSIIVRHKHSFGWWGFMQQRFQHGIQFGGDRAARFSVSRRVLYSVLSPAIPFIFLMRIVRQLLVKQRHWGKFVQALPILVLFLSAWTLGELVGYVRGATK